MHCDKYFPLDLCKDTPIGKFPLMALLSLMKVFSHPGT
ncbi:hypothetical protein SP38_201 [Salmonella phage 38]|uniref:Uncharacterized protein n=1 Tax=Salmonella phage 38 TaxID=1654891 RepID=A0A0N7CF12_9CAUD|nr:hypothetical protein SP38_201 [Salmonella phage 38]AKJ73803.1 hypothetical protein SP38_201 [Salmonella phage 38]